MISEAYRELNRRLHKDRPDYGTSGQHYAQAVQQLAQQLDSPTILDFGCGKRSLEQALGYGITNYDPCIAGLEASPEPHDLVVCTDVAEHVEPVHVDAFLLELRRCTRKVLFMTIATGPAVKHLADGRNAHLIQQGADWWLPKLFQTGFRLRQFNDLGGELAVVLT